MENNESKVRKILFNEISLLAGVIGLAISCVLFVSGPDASMKMDIALMQQSIEVIEVNHLKTIETRIDSIEIDVDEIKDDIAEINIAIGRILTILGD